MQIALCVRRIVQASIVSAAVVFLAGRASAQLGGIPAGVSPQVASDPFTVEPSATYSSAAHVANGASLRNVGSATIRVQGMPGDAKVIQAWLYWDFTSLATPTVAQSNVFFGRQQLLNLLVPIAGTQIGSGADPCWFGGSNFAFRADVTRLVRANGNYIVKLFPKASSSVNGSNPWGPTAPTTGPLAEGASLLVIYSSSAEPTGTVLVYDQGLAATEFVATSLSYNLDAVPTPPGISSSIFTEIGADGQIGAGVTAVTGYTGETTSLNSNPIAGPGSLANDSDWNGTDGVPLNQLWDTHSHDVTGLLVAGLNDVTVTSTNDCLVTIANAVTVR